MTGFQEQATLELIKASLPKARSWFENVKEEYEHVCEHKFLPFIKKEYNQLNVSTSMLFRNQGYKINELYVPLSIVETSKNNKYKIDCYPQTLFEDYNKIIISDNAGMGKSTLLKMIFRYSIDDVKLIPFYIDMKSLINAEKVLSVEDYLINSFPSFTKTPSKEFILKLFDNNQYLFLFDGADEVPDKFKEEVYKSINKFVNSAKRSRFVVATREEDIILSSFYDFILFKIESLTIEEAYDLLKKYEFKDVKADDLITEIGKVNNDSIREFLKNPLLTTLLYTAYSFKKKIPLKKSLFYKQIYNALYENHDATKRGYLTRVKKSGLDIDDFEKILSSFSFYSKLCEKLEYTETELKEALVKISDKHPTIKFNVRSFMQDLISTVPVFRKDGLVYSWQHKSIQEYFFVRFILLCLEREEKEKFIKKIISSNNSQKYKLALDILYDEDQELFHNVATREVYNLFSFDDERYNSLLEVFGLIYKYSINVDEIFSTSDIEDMFSEDHHNARKDGFDYICESRCAKYNLSGYGFSSLGNGNGRLHLVLKKNEAIVLTILNEKKSELVKKLVFDRKSVIEEIIKNENFSENSFIGPVTELGMKYISLKKSNLVPDVEKMKCFLMDYDSKIKSRRSLIDDFDILL